MQLSSIDIKEDLLQWHPKAHHSDELPRELALPTHQLGLQVRCVYGTHDAGAIWMETYRAVMVNGRSTPGIASPCIHYQDERDLTCVIHGDAFTTLGNDEQLDWMEKMLAESFEIKLRGRWERGVLDRMRFEC